VHVSDQGLIEICEYEGIVPAPYRDSVGVWTYGVGHTSAAGGVDPREMNGRYPGADEIDAAVDRALAVFRADVVKYENRVNAAIKVPLAQHQFDALVSFDINTGGINRAKLTAAINARNPDAARHFFGWLKPPEIRGRRTAEHDLFVSGDYAANGDRVPVWRTDGKGNLAGILETVSGAEILRRMGGTHPPLDHVPAKAVPGVLGALVAALGQLLARIGRKAT